MVRVNCSVCYNSFWFLSNINSDWFFMCFMVDGFLGYVYFVIDGFGVCKFFFYTFEVDGF